MTCKVNLAQAINSNIPYLIAECAYSHQGEKEYLIRQVNGLKNSYVDAIKFHILFNKNEYFSKKHPFYNKIDKWLFPENFWYEILKKSKDFGLEVIVLTDDISSIEFLEKNNDLVDGIEIHAACINDIFLLEKAIQFAKENKKVFISGISGLHLDEIFTLNNILKEANVNDVLFMYGFQNYPTKIEDIKLRNLKVLKEITGRKIGYADHTEFNNKIKEKLILCSYSLGANIQEIHYVIKEGEERIDYITAKEVGFFNKIKKDLINIYKALGNVDLQFNSGEINYMKIRKSPVFNKNLEKGTIVTENDISFKRVDDKDTEMKKIFEYKNILGKKLIKPVKKDYKVKKDLFE